MEIKTNINRNLSDTGYIITSGTIIIVDKKIVQFIQDEEQLRQQSLSDIQDNKVIKSNKATYKLEYINKYDKYHNLYNAKITIINGSSFYVKLNLFQRLKIKWMLDKWWVQNNNNAWNLLLFIVGTALTILWILTTLKGINTK